MVEEPVFVIVRFSVSPLFQAFTVALTRQAPDPPLGDGDGEGDDDGDGDADGDGEAEGEGEGEGDVDGPDWNWVKNFHTSAEVQVLAPLVEVDPSFGEGVWSPSNAAQTTGYPARHPE
uniref:hypothetical protein n=1 Tax=Microbispora siamensis TaxID=564413 RepID=UPI0035714B9D